MAKPTFFDAKKVLPVLKITNLVIGKKEQGELKNFNNQSYYPATLAYVNEKSKPIVTYVLKKAKIKSNSIRTNEHNAQLAIEALEIQLEGLSIVLSDIKV